MKDFLSSSEQLETAVLLLVFNRPDTTLQVFEALRTVRPTRLYVACDGPRKDRKDEASRVSKVREIVTAVDWPCEVKTLFQDSNLGCKYAVSTGISWFFENEPHGIILEDDCLPSQSFFWFCQDMLRKYRDDPQIMAITGTNISHGIDSEESYFFSIYPLMWGWASWSRAWKLYDLELESWPSSRRADFLKTVRPGNIKFQVIWTRIFQLTYDGGVDTWDFQWIYSCWRHGGLTIAPARNLISNLGFSVDATHTTKSDPIRSKCPLSELEWPLIAPETKETNDTLDQYISRNWFDESWANAFKSLMLLNTKISRLNKWFKK